MRILVTGASGLLGINLALEAAQGDWFQDQDTERVVFGAVNRHALVTDAFKVVESDLLVPGELERLVDKTQPDWIIHCAALALLDACEADPDLALKMNVELPEKLASYVARGGARLVHISTDAVFDGRRGNYTEEDLPNPLSVYARTKLQGEQVVAQANPEALIARVNLFGWSLSGTRSLAEWFYNNLSSGRRVLGFTDVYFCPLLVNDLARILFRMLVKGLHGLYHVVSPECTSKYAFGVALARQFSLDAELIAPASVQQSGLKAARSPMLSLRCDKLSGALGHTPPTWQDGLVRFHQQYLQGYPQFIKSLSETL